MQRTGHQHEQPGEGDPEHRDPHDGAGDEADGQHLGTMLDEVRADARPVQHDRDVELLVRVREVVVGHRGEGVLREGLEELLVQDVETRRKLPATVQLVVTEVEPVALAAAGELRPVDAAGWLLPVDPAGLDLDLPLLSGVGAVNGRLTAGDGGRHALEVLMTLRRDAPEVAERVSQIERQGGMLRVVFRDQAAEALLPLDASGLQVRQLRLAYADLVSRGELGRVRRIDLRFRDQVVVSFLGSPVS